MQLYWSYVINLPVFGVLKYKKKLKNERSKIVYILYFLFKKLYLSNGTDQ